MGEIVSIISNTPVPSILVVGGMFFILLSVAGQIASQITIPKERQSTILVIGVVLLVIGTLLYLIPTLANPQKATATPEGTAAAETLEPASPAGDADPGAGQAQTTETGTPDEAAPSPTAEVVTAAEGNRCEILLTESNSWDVVASDNFNVNQFGWLEGEESYDQLNVNKSFENGVYSWVMQPHVENWVHYTTPILDPVGDFYLSVDVDFIDPNQGMEAGLVLRQQGNNYYTFGINQLPSEYVFAELNEGSWNNEIDYTRVAAFLPGSRNTLTVVAEETEFCFFINNQLVGTVQDDTLPFGNIGVYLFTFEPDTSYTVTFDNLMLKTKP